MYSVMNHDDVDNQDSWWWKWFVGNGRDNKDDKEQLKAQGVGNMFYGLQGMKSDCPEVRALLRELPGLVKTCTKRGAQAVGMMLYGL